MNKPNIVDGIEAIKDFETVKEIDKTLAMFPRALRALLSGMQIWTLKREAMIQDVANAINEKLKKHDEEEIVEPAMHIGVPALQALSYSMDSEELKNMYTNLLEKSMLRATKDSVHPGFVDIIRQLSPLDARIFESSYERKYTGIIEIRGIERVGAPGKMIDIFRNIIPETVSNEPNEVAMSVDNLKRLGLVYVDMTAGFDTEELYEYGQNKVVLNLLQEADFQVKSIAPELTALPVKGKMGITPWGQHFAKICL